MMQRTLACAALVAAVSAQDHVITLGHSAQSGNNLQSFPAARVKDANFDGNVTVPTELTAFLSRCYTTRNYSATEPYPKCFYTDVRYAIENGEPVFYFSESEEGRIVRGADANHDGVLQDTEVTEFYMFGTRFAPDCIGAWRDRVNNRTIVYVGMDATVSGQTQRGIWRMIDLNGDGDASDVGEAAPFVQAGMNLTVAGTGGPVPITSDDFENLRVLPNGKVIAFQAGADVAAPYTPTGDRFAWLGFTDNNGTAVPEVFFNGTALNGFAQYPDFANSTFPTFDIAGNAVGTRHFAARFLDVAAGAGPNGENVYFLSMKRQQNRGGDTNINGTSVSGLIYRAVDANRNDQIDAGELQLFANLSGSAVPGTTVPVVTWIDQSNGVPVAQVASDVYAASAADDGSYSFIYDVTLKAIVTVKDADANGRIDQGEANMTYYSARIGGLYTAPYHTTFGPFVMGLQSIPDGLIPGPLATGVSSIGDGCTMPAKGLRAVMDAFGGLPRIGTTTFQVGALRNLPLVPAFVLADFAPAPTPLNLSIFGLSPQCFSYLGTPTTVGFVLADNIGRALQPINIPNNNALIGGSLVFQMACFDPLNPAVAPYYTTNALQVTVQP
ncbi:MAG: hypothetical protein IPK26_08755 [Planctomycetes bacterium]|nr:hypothetical protein [Planctomycetota bacterium]